MAHRTFQDAKGRTWQVWTVLPTFVERRLTPPSPEDPPVIERRLRPSEKRRLAPYPPEWVDFTEGQLVELCAQASQVPRPRRP